MSYFNLSNGELQSSSLGSIKKSQSMCNIEYYFMKKMDLEKVASYHSTSDII